MSEMATINRPSGMWSKDGIAAWDELLDHETFDELVERHGDGPHEWLLEELDRVLNEGANLDPVGAPAWYSIALKVAKRLGYEPDDSVVVECLFQFAVSLWIHHYQDEWRRAR